MYHEPWWDRWWIGLLGAIILMAVGITIFTWAVVQMGKT